MIVQHASSSQQNVSIDLRIVICITTPTKPTCPLNVLNARSNHVVFEVKNFLAWEFLHQFISPTSLDGRFGGEFEIQLVHKFFQQSSSNLNMSVLPASVDESSASYARILSMVRRVSCDRDAFVWFPLNGNDHVRQTTFYELVLCMSRQMTSTQLSTYDRFRVAVTIRFRWCLHSRLQRRI